MQREGLTLIPPPRLCTDNAAMVAAPGLAPRAGVMDDLLLDARATEALG